MHQCPAHAFTLTLLVTDLIAIANKQLLSMELLFQREQLLTFQLICSTTVHSTGRILRSLILKGCEVTIELLIVIRN